MLQNVETTARLYGKVSKQYEPWIESLIKSIKRRVWKQFLILDHGAYRSQIETSCHLGSLLTRVDSASNSWLSHQQTDFKGCGKQGPVCNQRAETVAPMTNLLSRKISIPSRVDMRTT